MNREKEAMKKTKKKRFLKETKEERFLRTAKIVKIEPLQAGTGYCAGRIFKEFPGADKNKVLDLLRDKFFEGKSEPQAVEEVILILSQGQ